MPWPLPRCRPVADRRSRGRRCRCRGRASWRSIGADRPVVRQPADRRSASGPCPGLATACSNHCSSAPGDIGARIDERPRRRGVVEPADEQRDVVALGRPEVDGAVGEDRDRAVGRGIRAAARGHARQSTRPARPPVPRPSSSGVERLEQERRRRRRVVEQGQRAARPGPGDVGEPALLLERPLRLRRVGERACAREPARPCRGRRRGRTRGPWSRGRSRSVSGASSRAAPRAAPARRDRGAQLLEVGRNGAAQAEDRGRDVGARRGPSGSASGDRVVRAQPSSRTARRSRRARQRRAGLTAVGGRDRGRPSTRASSTSSAVAAAGTGSPRSSAPRPPAAARGSSGPGSPRGRRRRPGQVAHRARPPRTRVVRRRRRRGRSGRRPSGRAHDRLREPLAVVLDEPDGAPTTVRRAAVVDVSRSTRRRPGQVAGEAEDPPDVGEPPAVDRLVVVARRGRSGCAGAASSSASSELRPVEVLRLVDEEVRAPRRASARARAARPRGGARRGRRGRRSRGRPRASSAS